jgi:hypothetical protein
MYREMTAFLGVLKLADVTLNDGKTSFHLLQASRLKSVKERTATASHGDRKG